MSLPDPILSGSIPMWAELLVSGLLVASGVLSLTAAIGLVRLQDFFQRMHPVALCATLGCWCVSLANAVFFSVFTAAASLHAVLIPLFLAVTVPVTTILLARAALFRARAAGADVPPALTSSPAFSTVSPSDPLR